MSREWQRPSRRSVLRSLAGAAGAGSLAGCTDPLGGSPTPTARESNCGDGDTDAAALYDDWLIRLTPAEFTGSVLTFSTANLGALREYPGVRRLAEPYLYYPATIMGKAALRSEPVERVTTLRAPGETRAAYVAFRVPADDLERRAWFGNLKRNFAAKRPVSFERLDDFRGYARYSVSAPRFRLLAYDDERVIVFPEAADPVAVGAGARMRRLVATRRGGAHPYHCYRASARELVTRLPANDLAFAWLRTDGGTFDGGVGRVPVGARASAFHARLRLPGRESGRSTGTANSDARSPVEASTARSDEGAARSGPPVDLGMVVAFPEGAADEGAVREYVRENRTASGTRTGSLRFDDPTYESAGRVVTVSETRPYRELVG